MHRSHASAAPESVYVAHEKVAVETLDRVAPPYLAAARKTFLKIDAQGYEDKVLDGGTAVLRQIDGVLLEMSLVELYEGQILWGELLSRMESSGFTLWAFAQGFVDPQTMKTLQVDGIFLRSSVLAEVHPK